MDLRRTASESLPRYVSSSLLPDPLQDMLTSLGISVAHGLTCFRSDGMTSEVSHF